MSSHSSRKPAPSSTRASDSKVGFNWRKLVDRDHDWDRDELGDVLHWMRQIEALICGLIWGLIPLTGGLWFAAFMALNLGSVFLYYNQLLCIDEEDFGGHSVLMQEGMLSSVGLFMLVWILIYSCVYFP
eukprot:TRINITY_DN2753_c0_g1_i3.p1 TRINITY_DN2753_c0_g1~~TRINITY_DN2753_c0_g1_i3.p1  ORF type:complete len:129 (-),score=20.65 TRINITY_DN2753_c0_g1_i3:338-724(-)